MAWGRYAIFGVVLVVAALILAMPAHYACAYWWHSSHWSCDVLRILHVWQTLVSGLLALGAAGATIFFLHRQLKQSERHRAEDKWVEACAIADMIIIDLKDTAQRIRHLERGPELDPAPSDTARQLLLHATKIAPMLALALQKHCSEIGVFRSSFQHAAGIQNANEQQVLKQRRTALAFRADALASSFAQARAALSSGEKPRGPFIDEATLHAMQGNYGASTGDRGYLNLLIAGE